MIDGLPRVACKTAWRSASFRVSAASLAAALAACAVGPDYRSPAPPPGDAYTPTPLPRETAAAPGVSGVAQRFAGGEDIPAQWWSLFHSEALDGLIRVALANSPNVAAAHAALRQAQENLSGQTGALLLPGVDLQAGATREKIAGIAFGLPPGVSPELTLYNASVNVSYKLDLFGGARRQLEALGAQVDYQRFQLQAAYLVLSANLVTAAVREASLRAQIEATERIAADQQDQLNVLERQYELGGTGLPAVLAQITQLAQTRASLPPLQQSLSQVRHQMSVLAGKLPSDASLPQFTLDAFSLPRTLPVSLPSSLVRQRPDILAADAVLHQASAQIGVATAAMYPQLTLTGSYGAEALTPAQLFRAASTVWSVGAGILQPVFHGGQLSAQKRAAVAAYDLAAAQYRETVLLAFQNVADTLRALEMDARSLQAQSDAWSAAQDSLEVTRRQYQAGGAGYLALLDAQRQYQQALVSLVQARAARYADTAALFQALGGGWWNAPPPPPPPPPPPDAGATATGALR